jgi:hypothetical protein
MNIHEYYATDERRRSSEEVEYGDGWTDSADVHATYRIHWVAATGEIYAVREPHPGGILARYLDEVDVDQADVDALTVDILGVLDGPAAARALAGWPEVMEHRDSLTWARDRVRTALSSSSPA